MNEKRTGKCWYCGSDLAGLDFGRGDTCTKCGRDTRVCKNCVFFDIHSNNSCRESQADRVVEKERSNFCDYFNPSSANAGTGAPTRDALKAAADALFKKK